MRIEPPHIILEHYIAYVCDGEYSFYMLLNEFCYAFLRDVNMCEDMGGNEITYKNVDLYVYGIREENRIMMEYPDATYLGGCKCLFGPSQIFFTMERKFGFNILQKKERFIIDHDFLDIKNFLSKIQTILDIGDSNGR